MAPNGALKKHSPCYNRDMAEQASVDRLLKTCLRHVEGPDRVTLYKTLQYRDAETTHPLPAEPVADKSGQRASGAKEGRHRGQRTGRNAAAAVSNGR